MEPDNEKQEKNFFEGGGIAEKTGIPNSNLK